MISFLNDCVLALYKNQKYTFLKLDRAEKLKVSKEQMNKIKNSSIKDLLEEVKISKKYKQYNEDTNKKNLDALIKEPCWSFPDRAESLPSFTKPATSSPGSWSGARQAAWFQKIFDMKILDLFVYYYNNEQPLKEITLFGKKVLFKTTKSFSALLQKNKKTEDKMVEFTKIIYFDDSNSLETV